MESDLSNLLSARVSASAVDAGSAGAADAEGGQDSLTRALHDAAELDFEARNWTAARSRFQTQSKHDSERVVEFLSAHETPDQAKEYCMNMKTRASKEYIPAIGGVLSKMEAFMRIGDVAMTGAPESIGLAWMGIRLCMHSVQDDFATFSLFSGAASDIIGILISCRAYGKMFGGDGGPKGLPDFQELHEKVVGYIPKIYSDILEFSYQMRKHMGRNIGVRFVRGILSSAVAKFKGMIDGIRFSEVTMSKYAQQASQQLQIYYSELSLQKQNTSLENQNAMMEDLTAMKDILVENNRSKKSFDENLKELQNMMKQMKKKTPLEVAKEKFDDNKAKLRPTMDSANALERARAMRSEGTCEWIFATERYQEWRSSTSNSIIWIQGDGGMGKSVLMATIIDRLQKEVEGQPGSAAQFFICSAKDDSTQITAHIQGQLVYGLYELVSASASLENLEKANAIVDRFLGPENLTQSLGIKKSAATNFADTYSSLIKVLENRVYLVIDALDECKDRQPSKFLHSLQGLITPSEAPEHSLSIVLCSRPEADLIEDLSKYPTIKIQEHNGPDIEHDAKTKLETLPGLSTAERELACAIIVRKAQGLFRCVDPAIDFLKKPWRRPLERALEKLPDGLTNSYQQIFQQTDPQYLDLLKTALHWCILGKRKPTVAEIMDDYSRAYEQDDGSDVNPYDQLEDPAVSTEMKRVIHNQIREAGGNTFLEVDSGSHEVKVRHTTVTDFFLLANPELVVTHSHSQDQPCQQCQRKEQNGQRWNLSRKEGHLRMATTIFQHLNSPLFHKRYLPQASEPTGDVPDTTGEVETDVSSAGAVNGALEAKPSAEEVHIEVTPPTGLSQNESNGEDSVSKDENSIDTENLQDTRETVDPNANAALASEDAKLPNGAGADDANEEQITTEPNSLAVEKEGSTDDGESSVTASELSQDNEQIETDRATRYELVYWPYHLQEVESCWSREEKANHPLLRELWALVTRFFCEIPSAFRAWQLKYRVLPEGVWTDPDEILNPLQIAAAYGLTGFSEILIQRGESLSATDSNGCSALWYAAGNDIELLRLLLQHGGDPNSFKRTLPAFHRVLYLNQPIEKVKLMIEFQADCKLHAMWGFTPIHWCGGWCQDPEILRLLTANGAEMNAIDEDGETGLHKLMWQFPTPTPLLEEFLKKGAVVNLADKEGQQPLYEVCDQGSEVGCRILLEHGADIDHADVNGITALHAAARNGWIECEKVLVEWNASLIKTDKHSRTAFWHACSNGYAGSAKLLLEAAHKQGCHEIVHMAADDGRSPFSKACGRGHLEVVKALWEHDDVNIDINACEALQKRTPLHWAAKNGRAEVVSFLLKEGADAKLVDKNGKTALSLSNMVWSRDKQSQRESVILELIDHDSATATQDSALMENAAIRGSVKIIEKLIAAGSDPTKQDVHGWTPLQLANQYGHTEVVAVLAKRGIVIGSRPSRWTTELSVIKISPDARLLENTSKGPIRYTILSNHPVPAGILSFYFETTISHNVGPSSSFLAIGFATQPARFESYLPGWDNSLSPSWGYHGDDGKIFSNTRGNENWVPQPYGKGETVGCGVVYANEGAEGRIFFTKGGKSLGWAFESGVIGRLYPAVGMKEEVACTTNWGDDLEARPFLWPLANKKTVLPEDVEPAPDINGAAEA